jgi:hypothetical protein
MKIINFLYRSKFSAQLAEKLCKFLKANQACGETLVRVFLHNHSNMYIYYMDNGIFTGNSNTRRYRKPQTKSPPEYKPPPVYKPTTCTNAHIIPNISPPEYKPTRI